MKKIIFVFALLLGFMVADWAFGEEPPAYMKDGVITVTLKSGKVYTYSTNEWKVVRRGTSTKAPIYLELAKREPASEEGSQNRITVHGGVGFNGLKASVTSPGVTEVSARSGFVWGVTYSRKISREFSLSVTGLSNETGLLGVGYDF